jgi:hypothetical protein
VITGVRIVRAPARSKLKLRMFTIFTSSKVIRCL